MPGEDAFQVILIEPRLFTQETHPLAVLVAPGLERDGQKMLGAQHAG